MSIACGSLLAPYRSLIASAERWCPTPWRLAFESIQLPDPITRYNITLTEQGQVVPFGIPPGTAEIGSYCFFITSTVQLDPLIHFHMQANQFENMAESTTIGHHRRSIKMPLGTTSFLLRITHRRKPASFLSDSTSTTHPRSHTSLPPSTVDSAQLLPCLRATERSLGSPPPRTPTALSGAS